MHYQLQSERAIYSASVEDMAIVFWALEVQLKVSLAIMKKYPVWDLWSFGFEAQSESVHAYTPSPESPL